MTLLLDARHVAQMNVEHSGRLGAFNGATTCRYHYRVGVIRPGCVCPIGIADPDHHLLELSVSIHQLYLDGVIHCTNCDLAVLSFIQFVHDVIVAYGHSLGRLSEEKFRKHLALANDVIIPFCVVDLVMSIDLLDESMFRKIMQQIADV